jgi:hypothetical protein
MKKTSFSLIAMLLIISISIAALILVYAYI